MWFENYFNINLYIGNTGKKNKELLNKYENNVTFINIFNKKLQDALHRYYIENLPYTCSQRVILQSLLWYGNVVFFEKEGALLALPGAPSGAGYNVNGDPGSSWVWGRNGRLNEEIALYLPGEDISLYLKKTSGDTGLINKKKGVIVWENSTRYPFVNSVVMYSQKIADSMRTLDTMRKNLKNPFIIACTESEIKSVNEFLEKRDNNEDVIALDIQGIDISKAVQILPIAQQAGSLSECTQLIEWYESKFREICGINANSQQDKKGENLIEAELSVNDEYQEQSLDETIAYIQEGLDNVNKIFGLNMQVKRRKDNYDINKNIPGDKTGNDSLS